MVLKRCQIAIFFKLLHSLWGLTHSHFLWLRNKWVYLETAKIGSNSTFSKKNIPHCLIFTQRKTEVY